MSVLTTEQLTLAYDAATIIQDLAITIPSGQITALVGPNGCGKSTLLRGLARLLTPRSGSVLLDGRAIQRIPTRELAKQLGILPQGPVAPEGLTVRELVAQGRYPHQSWFQQWATDDEQAVAKALTITGMAELADRPVDALSGGQRQRAWIAMTLAQETQIILLDEPTTFLDLSHQIEVLHLLEQLNRAEGRTIVMVVHDLNHATRHAQHIMALRAGQVVAAGPPTEVVTPELLRNVFGVEADIIPDPRLGVPLCIPYGLTASHLLATALLPVPQLSAAELVSFAELTATPILLDVRSAEEYAAGHIPGAAQMTVDQLAERYTELPAGQLVVTYCSMQHPGSSRSERAAALLRDHGINAHVLVGGFPAWQALQQPLPTSERAVHA
jgi:iron complex transport system ATP-binding protein